MTYTYELSKTGYDELESGTRTFLLLKDKGYTVGDVFLIQDPVNRKELKLEIQYLEKEFLGLKKGYVIIGVKESIF